MTAPGLDCPHHDPVCTLTYPCDRCEFDDNGPGDDQIMAEWRRTEAMQAEREFKHSMRGI